MEKEYFNIPNLMGYFRILLIPVFLLLYYLAEIYWFSHSSAYRESEKANQNALEDSNGCLVCNLSGGGGDDSLCTPTGNGGVL